MKIDQLKLLFDAGDLISAVIVPASLEPGPRRRWMLQIRRRSGAEVVVELNRRAPNGAVQARIFNTLDAAYSAARSIGFRMARIEE